MANLPGLTVNIGLDHTAVTRSMKSLKGDISLVNSEMRKNMSAFDWSEKSAKKYETRISGLQKKLEIQGDVVKAARKELSDMTAEYGANSEQAQKAQETLNKAEASYNNLERSVNRAQQQLADFNREQQIADSGWTKAGKAVEDYGEKLSRTGSIVTGVGDTLTKYITAPAIGAATAVGGIAVAFGWKRLTAMDTASAQLQGFTKDAKVSERIMEDVKEASKTGMATLAENTAIATGALAAGVKEGKDLRDYIKLVGDAATASGAPIDEMAQIFNRVQGSGKLMGTELDMIENRLPGFTATMAKSMGMSMEEFKKSVSEGKVTAEDFQEAMTERVDGTADLMANTWQGMATNVKSYMGILGEAAMSGVFEQMKDNLSDLIDILKSDAAIDFANKIGVILADALMKAMNVVKDVVQWFIDMDSGTRKLIGTITGIAIALGPVLAIGGRMITGIGNLMMVLGPMLTAIGKAGGLFAVLTGPIGLTILAIGGLATAFTVAYAKSETFREIIGTVIDKVMGGIEFIKDFGTAIKELFTSEDDEEGNNLLKKLGLTEGQIELVNAAVDTIKSAFNGLKDLALQAFGAIGNFFGDMVTKITVFWNENGEQIMQAIQNAIKGIGAVIEFVAPIVQTVFVGVFKVALFIVREIWESIKGVISGALDIILGTVKLFSSLFTGDFSGMWAGVKQIFSGAISFVWNIFSLLFYGRIIKGVGSLVKIFAESIKGLWTKVVGFFKNMFTGSVKQVQNLYNRAIDIGASIKSGLSDAIKGAKDKVVEYFQIMKNKATEYLDKIKEGVTALPGKMKDALIKGKDKVKEGIKELGNAMASKLGDVVNGVIGGINTVMSTIGIKKSISEWNVPQFSTGTNGQGSPTGNLTRNGQIAMDTLAVVGDRGPGNGKGTRELVHYPNGQVGLYDNDAMIFAPKGTTIFNNKQTEDILNQLPHFSIGTLWDKTKNVAGKAWQGVKNVGGKVKNIASSAIDYITNPSKVFDDLVSAVMPDDWGVGGFMKDFAKGIWNKAKSALFDWMKARFAEAGQGKKQSWMKRYPITTPYSPNKPVPGYPTAFNGGRHYGIDWGTPNNTNLTSPVAGTVKYQSDHGGGRVARVDYGKGAMYFLHMNSVKSGKVAIGESLGRSGNSGAYTTGPHVHVQDENPKTSFLMNKNTRDPLKMLKGAMRGAILKEEGLFWGAEKNKEEAVVPLDGSNEMHKLFHYIAGKVAQTSPVANGSIKKNVFDTSRIEEKLDKLIEVMEMFATREFNMNVDGNNIAKATFESVDELIQQRKKRNDRFRGVTI